MLYLLFKSEIYYTQKDIQNNKIYSQKHQLSLHVPVLLTLEYYLTKKLSFYSLFPFLSLALFLSPSLFLSLPLLPLPSYTGMALGYPPPSPVGSYAPLTPISMSAGIDLASNSGGGGAYSPPHNLSPKGSSSASVNGYNSQVRKIILLMVAYHHLPNHIKCYMLPNLKF